MGRNASQILVKARKWCNFRQLTHTTGNINLQTLSQFAAKNATLELELEKRRAFQVRLFHSIPSSLARLFHLPSMSALVLESMVISSGHGRVNPSVDHLRVASIPILEP
jgi:hypothetical protein